MLYRTTLLLVAAILLATCCGHALAQSDEASLEPLSITYRPDLNYTTGGLDFNQGWDLKDEQGERIQLWPDYFYVGATYEAYLQNNSTHTASIASVLIDGQPIEELIYPGSQIVWCRRSPQGPIGAGQIVQLMIRFRREPAEPVNLTINLEQGQPLEIVSDKEALPQTNLLSRVAMATDRTKIYAYIRTDQADLEIQSVQLDGYDLTNSTQTLAHYGNQIPIIVSLPQALTESSEHTIFIQHSHGTTAVRFRAWSCRFPFAVYGGPESSNMLAHHFDTNWTHRTPSVQTVIDRWNNGIESIAPFDPQIIRDVPGARACYLPDEPDVKDYFEFRDTVEPFSDRIGGLAPHMLELAEAQRQNAPDKLNVLVCDGTFSPINYYTYARIPDVLAVDKYSIQGGRQPSEIYGYACIGRQASEPMQTWFILGSYINPNADPETGNGRRRYPNSQEMRFMVLSGIAGGIQGLSYWTYNVGTRFYGAGGSPELWHTIGRINGELRPIAWMLAQAQPPVSNGVVEAHENMIAEVIRGPEDQATILALINKTFISDDDSCTVETIENATIRWTMPPNCDVHSIWRLSAQGPQNTEFTIANGVVQLNIPEMQEGEIYVAAHNAATAQRMLDIYNNIVEPLNRQADAIYRGQAELFSLNPTNLAALATAQTIAPTQESGGQTGTDAYLAKPGLDDTNPHRTGEENINISWNLPSETGILAFQYRSSHSGTLTITSDDGTENKFILPPSSRGRVVRWTQPIAGNEIVDITLQQGTLGRNLFILQQLHTEQWWQNTPGSYQYSGTLPQGQQEQTWLTFGQSPLADASLAQVTWSNSNNIMNTSGQIPEITIQLDQPSSIAAVALLGATQNRWHSIHSAELFIQTAENENLTSLGVRAGFSSEDGIARRNFHLYWNLPETQIEQLKLRLTPNNFYHMSASEFILIPRQ